MTPSDLQAKAARVVTGPARKLAELRAEKQALILRSSAGRTAPRKRLSEVTHAMLLLEGVSPA